MKRQFTVRELINVFKRCNVNGGAQPVIDELEKREARERVNVHVVEDENVNR